jgi:hypothetical protein
MKRPFIKVRFDRMQIADLKILCNEIVTVIKSADADSLQLNTAFSRFNKLEPAFDDILSKKRKLPQTEDIVKMRKRLDDLVSALLLHIKALERAQFPDQKKEVRVCGVFIQSQFKNFIHESMPTKYSRLFQLQNELKVKGDVYEALDKLGLIRYTDAITAIKIQLDVETQNRTDFKLKQPKPGITTPTKEEIISELKLLLQTIEITSITYSEANYKQLINDISYYLTEARAQLRNLASRRKTAKEKAEKKKEDVG